MGPICLLSDAGFIRWTGCAVDLEAPMMVLLVKGSEGFATSISGSPEFDPKSAGLESDSS